MAREEENRDMRIESGSIKVSVKDGEATLEGKVGSLQKKKLAEENAMDVAGVERVDNQLEVETEGSYSDEKIHAIILGEIKKADNIPVKQLALQVQGGKVSIMGLVARYVQRKRLMEIVQHTPGVREIENLVNVSRS